MFVPGSHSQALAAALAGRTGEGLVRASRERFPDGELLATTPGVDEGDDVVVVASTLSSDAHVELLQLQDAAREAGAGSVTTVIPYMGYARQDRAFKPGQPVSARAVARAISTGTDRVVLVNPHERRVAEFFTVPVATVDACPLLADPLPADLADPLFLAPDEAALELAEGVREAYGTGAVDFFEKERDHDTGDVTVRPSDAAVDGRDVVLVDDIVATGSTMAEAVDVLHERGVGRAFVTTVHPLLVGNARTRLAAAGVAGIYGTDTVERDVSAVSAAPAVAPALDD